MCQCWKECFETDQRKGYLNNRAVKEEENLRENEDLQKQTDQNIRIVQKTSGDTEILSQIEIKRSEIKLQNAILKNGIRRF
ncbi:MAG: hypothetical protein Ct9H300mP23_11100 [Nitrospinota bacterium]|nr:MAG: hypothetical protein Ct9H300mP23_11100 [Nitrospinota bacterium]